MVSLGSVFSINVTHPGAGIEVTLYYNINADINRSDESLNEGL